MPARRWALVALLILAGAAIRGAALPLPGSPDVDSWKIWTFVGATDATGFYGVGGHPPERRVLRWRGGAGTTEYPPLALYELAGVGRIYRAIDPLYNDTSTLTALVKMPAFAAELFFVVVMLTWGRRIMGAQAAVWVALAVWLNPAMILNGAVLGYLDPQMAIPAALSLLAASAGAPIAAGAFVALATLTKPQALFVVPFVMLAALHRERIANWRAFAGTMAGGLAATAAILLPIVARGAWPNMVQAMSRLAAHDMLSGQATNAWWLVTWVVRARAGLQQGWWAAFTMPVKILGITRFMEIGYPNPKIIGTSIVVLAWLYAMWRLRRGRTPAAFALGAAWSVFAYFMFGAQVHENHLLLAVPVSAVAAGLDPRLRSFFFVLTAICAANMYVFYGLGAGYPPPFSRSITIVDLTVVLSIMNAILFAWMTVEFFWYTTPKPQGSTPTELKAWLKEHGA
jgi:hypothetical protein